MRYQIVPVKTQPYKTNRQNAKNIFQKSEQLKMHLILTQQLFK